MAGMVLEKWGAVWSALASLVFLWSMLQNHIPTGLRQWLTILADKLTTLFSPYLHITISEYGDDRFRRSDFFLAVEAYLSHACARRARRLKADLGRDAKNLQVSVDDDQEVTDDFRDAML